MITADAEEAADNAGDEEVVRNNVCQMHGCDGALDTALGTLRKPEGVSMGWGGG